MTPSGSSASEATTRAPQPRTPTPGRDATQIDIGPGLLYIARLGAPEPIDPTDANWPATDWVELGYTAAGSEFKVTPTVDNITVAEEQQPVKTWVSSTTSVLTVEMVQITAFNWATAMGGGAIASGAGGTGPYVRFEPPVPGTEVEIMLGWRDVLQTEMMIFRRCKTDGTLDIKRQTGNNKASFPVNFTVLVPSGGLRPFVWVADISRLGADANIIFPGITTQA